MSDPEIFPTAKFFEEVGRLCAAWSFLEGQLQRAIWRILDVPESLGKHITYALDARRRWELLCEISETKAPDLHKAVKSNNETIKKLTADRNLIIHGALTRYITDGVASPMGWIVFKGAKAGKFQPASEEFVVETREAVQALAVLVLPTERAEIPHG